MVVVTHTVAATVLHTVAVMLLMVAAMLHTVVATVHHTVAAMLLMVAAMLHTVVVTHLLRLLHLLHRQLPLKATKIKFN
jgi:hypothetical protein